MNTDPSLSQIPADIGLMKDDSYVVLSANNQVLSLVDSSTGGFQFQTVVDTAESVQQNKWHVVQLPDNQFRLILNSPSYAITMTNNALNVQQHVSDQIEFTVYHPNTLNSMLLANGYYLNWDPTTLQVNRTLTPDMYNQVQVYWIHPNSPSPLPNPDSTPSHVNWENLALFWGMASVAVVGIVAAGKSARYYAVSKPESQGE